MQGSKNHLEGGFVFEFGVRVDGDAAAVIADGDLIGRTERKLDEGGVAGDGFVHRVVEDFGGEVVKGGLVGAADIHAWAATNGFEAFEDLDMLGAVVVLWFAAVEEIRQNSDSDISGQWAVVVARKAGANQDALDRFGRAAWFGGWLRGTRMAARRVTSFAVCAGGGEAGAGAAGAVVWA
jgi:hypothetical protein